MGATNSKKIMLGAINAFIYRSLRDKPKMQGRFKSYYDDSVKCYYTIATLIGAHFFFNALKLGINTVIFGELIDFAREVFTA